MLLSVSAVLLSLLVGGWAGPSSPNIVIVLTDDQDVALGGLTPMTQTLRLVAKMGVTCENAFASSPICCPSRASLLTGNLPHNVGVANNSAQGGCAGLRWQQQHEPITFPALLHDRAGYRTFYAGKYMNQYGKAASGGVSRVPPGWDWWLGLVGNSRYYNYTLSVNGTARHFRDHYLTDVIAAYALDFLHAWRPAHAPFLLMVAPPAPHAPFTPAPRHARAYPHVTAPRTPNFNTPNNTDKHWLLRTAPSPLPAQLLPALDIAYRKRWQTLLAVDELVAALVEELQTQDLLKNTFVFVTSDHGYHIGQFAQPWDKRQPYESDIRVPLLVRGPGLPRGKRLSRAVSLVDLAATVLDAAGLAPPPDMDGPSFLPHLRSPSTRRQPIGATKGEGRTLLVEYHGEGDDASIDAACDLERDNTLAECSQENLCKCQDARNNTYACLRHLSARQDFLFCRFNDTEDFEEMYDVRSDPFQLTNQAARLAPAKRKHLRQALERAQACRGRGCWDLEPRDVPLVKTV